MISSVQAQSYHNWQLCLADASPKTAGVTDVERIVREIMETEPRIAYVHLEENLGIAENTNAAIDLAQGDWIAFLDHDDLLAPDALFEAVDLMRKGPQTLTGVEATCWGDIRKKGRTSFEMIYTDEDKVDMEGKVHFQPHLKPDINLDLLRSNNYITHFLLVKRSLLERVGKIRKEYDGAQDYDFILRCCEQAKHVHHIPKILYHWRCHADSTAANPESKLYAFEAGRRAIEAHYMRLGIPAQVKNGSFYGLYRTIYQWEEEPLVSIIIPNKDHSQDLKKCMDSIYEKSGYRNFEFVIVENNSTEQETFDFYQQMQREHDNVTVVSYEGDFNYSRINNFGAAAAKGNYLLLLNNDTEMIAEDGIRELLGYCMRDDVGAVGAKLLYEDGTIQHAGVVVGFGGTAGHTFIGKSRYDTGYFGRILVAQDYSAVTAACMMTRKDVFDAVGGLTEEFAVAFNDIDYCLKVRRYGKLVVYNPYAEFYHYESKSRGLEDSPEKVERFQGETDRLLNTWRELVETGDPYYNPNLTLDNSDFSLRR
jgi:GT2 family glycosyltransferase